MATLRRLRRSAVLGLASHEKSLSGETIARSMLPFLVSWTIVGLIAGMFIRRVPEDWARLGLAWLAAAVFALCARALVFDRELFNAFFVIAIVGNGLFLFGWRFAYQMVSSRRGLRSA